MSYDNWLESPYDGQEKTVTVDVSCRHEFEDAEGDWVECPYSDAIEVDVWVSARSFVSFSWTCPVCETEQEEEMAWEDMVDL
jgi:rubredoxin